MIKPRPMNWTFIPDGLPSFEETRGGKEWRFCPICTNEPVLGYGPNIALRRRHYPEIPETYWDCRACKTTWRES